MRNLICTVEKHPEHGIIGLVPVMYRQWFKDGAYIPATELGHDLLAHGNNETGTVEDELKAIGAELWLTSFYQYTDTALNVAIAHNLSNTLIDDLRGKFTYTIPACDKKFSLADDVKERIEDEFAFIFDDLNMMLDDYLDDGDEKENYLINNKDNILQWMFFGYAQAQKRYKRHDRWQLWHLRNAIDISTKNLELIVGQRYMLSYSIKHCYASIKEV